MEALTIRMVARNPTAFLRMFLPLCLEFPRVRSGDRYTVFEILTRAEELVTIDAYDRYEMDMILGMLEAQGFEQFTPEYEVKTLARYLNWRFGGMEIFAREFPFLERLSILKEACEIHAQFGSHRILKEVELLFSQHSPNPASNVLITIEPLGSQ